MSMMDVSVRNDDMPSISPSDGSLISSPKLFLSRYAKNDALHFGHVLAFGFTCVSHLWHLPRIWAIPGTCRATVHNCLVVGPRRIVLRPNSPLRTMATMWSYVIPGQNGLFTSLIHHMDQPPLLRTTTRSHRAECHTSDIRKFLVASPHRWGRRVSFAWSCSLKSLY